MSNLSWRQECIEFYEGKVDCPYFNAYPSTCYVKGVYRNQHKYFEEYIFSNFEKKPNSILLDIGCNTGNLGKLFSCIATNTIGVDLVYKAIVKSKINNNYSLHINADGVDLPIQDGSVDICTIIDSLSTCNSHEEIDKLIYRATKTLKPGGIIIVQSWSIHNFFIESLRALRHACIRSSYRGEGILSRACLNRLLIYLKCYIKPKHKNLVLRLPTERFVIKALRKNPQIRVENISKRYMYVFPTLSLLIVGKRDE